MSFRTRFLNLKFFLKSHPLFFLGICVVALGAMGSVLKYLDEDAQRQKLLKPSERSSLARFNPFLAPPSPTPTPQLSKEYIYAGSRLLAVEDANANAAPPADLAVWRPSNGTWYVLGGTGSAQTTQAWGISGDTPVPGDFDGDGKTDFAVYREDAPSAGLGKWYFIYSSNNSLDSIQYGLTDDLPAQADYDGDGKTDRAVFRPSNQTWYFTFSSNWSTTSYAFGNSGDVPAPADYDGDGRADLSVWRPGNTTFYSVNSSNNGFYSIAWPYTGEFVSGDYDGDGKADLAVFDTAATPYAKWYIRNSIDGTLTGPIEWGLSGDKAVPNDYDGDGKCDIATWRNSNGHWYIRQSALNNALRDEWWGLPGDIPVPAYFRR